MNIEKNQEEKLATIEPQRRVDGSIVDEPVGGKDRSDQGPPVAGAQSETQHSVAPQTPQAPKAKKPRGLAAASVEVRRLVARKGGEAVSKNRKHMAEIGRKGGETVSQDRKHMSEIGKKGGEAVSQNREHMAEIGRKGGEARGAKSEAPHSGSSTETESEG